MASAIEESYKALCRESGSAGLGQPAVTTRLIACARESLTLLAGLPRVGLISNVPGKEYFVFESSTPKYRSSRGINQALFVSDIDEVTNALSRIVVGDVPQDPVELHSALYTAAISFPAAIDVTKDGDRKSPGTFLENLVGHLVASTFGVRPTTKVVAPTLDLEISLPTDFIFELGPGKSRIHPAGKSIDSRARDTGMGTPAGA